MERAGPFESDNGALLDPCTRGGVYVYRGPGWRTCQHSTPNIGYAMLRDQSWQEPLFESLAPRSSDRIVAFGPGSGWTATMLARRFPKTSFVAVDPDLTSFEKAQRDIERHQIVNVH
ncbi:hypothetical protein E4T56_gene7825, partial [Termitomyces sp. T112]